MRMTILVLLPIYGIVKVVDVFNEYGRASSAKSNGSSLGLGDFGRTLLVGFLWISSI